MRFGSRQPPAGEKAVYKTLYIKCSLAERINEIAVKNETSFNNVVISMIESWLKEEQDTRSMKRQTIQNQTALVVHLPSSGLRLDLRPALGTGDDDLPLAHRHPADGPAVLAGEVPVVLVGPAGGGVLPPALEPPDKVHPFLVLRPALVEIPGEHPEQDIEYQSREKHRENVGDEAVSQRRADHHLRQPQHQIRPKQRPVQLVHAVAAVHEPDHPVPHPLKNAHTPKAPFAACASCCILLAILGIDNCLTAEFTK